MLAIRQKNCKSFIELKIMYKTAINRAKEEVWLDLHVIRVHLSILKLLIAKEVSLRVMRILRQA